MGTALPARRLIPAITVLAGLALLLPSARADVTAPIYWKNENKPATVEPARINIQYSTGFAWATGLTDWQNWGTKTAFANGTLHLNTCKPFCAAGNYKAYAGRVTLFKVRKCGNQRRYLDIKIKRVNQPPVTWGSNCAGLQIKAP